MWNPSVLPFSPGFNKATDSFGRNTYGFSQHENKRLKVSLSANCSRLTGLLEGTVSEGWISDYSVAVKKCVDEFSALNGCLKDYKKESIVIAACSGPNRMFDYFGNLIDFYNRIDATQSAERIAVKGYSNYLFVVKCLMKELTEEYEAYETDEAALEFTARSFLREECLDQPLLKSWQDFRTRVKPAVLGISAGNNELAALLQESEQFEFSLKSNKGVLCEYMTAKASAYALRRQKMEKDISKGNALYRDLCSLLTDELFDSFDPDSQDEFTKDLEQVKGEYKALTDELVKIKEKYAEV